MTLYLYGPLGWVWRIMAMAAISGGVVLIWLAVSTGLWALLAAALPLILPALVLPWMVASRIDAIDDASLAVTNLFFIRRIIPRASLGTPRVRHTAQGSIDHIAAPRAWIPVRGGTPIYVDLNATIPDPGAFRTVLKLPRSR